MRFLVRRECVLEDTLRTVQWPNFCVYDRIVVSFSFCMWLNISTFLCIRGPPYTVGLKGFS